MNEMQRPPYAPASGTVLKKQCRPMAALIAATTAGVVLSVSAWAASEDGASRMQPHGMGMMAPGSSHAGGLPFGGRQLQRLLDDANASDLQRTQIKQIVGKAQSDLKALHAESKGLHEQGLKLWAAPKIDAGAAEKIRQQMQAHHDKVSKRLLQAMLDAGNVLTPEQRALVAKQMEKHHDDMMRRMQEHREGREAARGERRQGASERQPEGR
jgi:protein CpxP